MWQSERKAICAVSVVLGGVVHFISVQERRINFDDLGSVTYY